MPKEIEVVWYNSQRGSWCQAIVEFLTEEFRHCMDRDGSYVHGDGAIVVVKADQITDIGILNRYVKTLEWVLLIVTANEDGTWQRDGFRHPNSLVWLQAPHKHQHAHRFIPWGWTPGCAKERNEEKTLDWFFAGQITHRRREEFLKVVEPALTLHHDGGNEHYHGELNEYYSRETGDALYREFNRHCVTSNGFAKGIPQDEYYDRMTAAKVIPCPSGPITVDSLRACEALQLGAVPVLDSVSPTGAYPEYWQRVFPKHPFEVIAEWRMFPFQMEHILKNWQMVSEVTQKYWSEWKQNLKKALAEDLRDLGAI